MATTLIKNATIVNEGKIFQSVNVGAMLLVFIAFIAMANYFLQDFIGNFTAKSQISIIS